jgi:hypothetical protein
MDAQHVQVLAKVHVIVALAKVIDPESMDFAVTASSGPR